MSVLVFGKTGQIATELREQSGIINLGREAANLIDPTSCAATIYERQPVAVINAAAYTAVDRAESDEELAKVINGDAPSAMAKACADLDIPFIHISTDYVFNGIGSTPWSPQDETDPIGAYGRSKLVGEEAVQTIGGQFVVLRTSWVFSAYGSNFVKTILRLAESHERLTVVADQFGGPTPARDVAATCISIVNTFLNGGGKSGIYHYAGAPDTTWSEFARAIILQSGHNTIIEEITSKDYFTPATRPLNSRMDCTEIETQFGIERPDWRQGLSNVLWSLGVVSK